jgi:hypothetical protein
MNEAELSPQVSCVSGPALRRLKALSPPFSQSETQPSTAFHR